MRVEEKTMSGYCGQCLDVAKKDAWCDGQVVSMAEDVRILSELTHKVDAGADNDTYTRVQSLWFLGCHLMGQGGWEAATYTLEQARCLFDGTDDLDPYEKDLHFPLILRDLSQSLIVWAAGTDDDTAHELLKTAESVVLREHDICTRTIDRETGACAYGPAYFANVYQRLAVCKAYSGCEGEVEELFRKAFELLEPVRREHPQDFIYNHASLCLDVGVWLVSLGRTDDARCYFTEADDLCMDLVRDPQMALSPSDYDALIEPVDYYLNIVCANG